MSVSRRFASSDIRNCVILLTYWRQSSPHDVATGGQPVPFGPKEPVGVRPPQPELSIKFQEAVVHDTLAIGLVMPRQTERSRYLTLVCTAQAWSRKVNNTWDTAHPVPPRSPSPIQAPQVIPWLPPQSAACRIDSDSPSSSSSTSVKTEWSGLPDGLSSQLWTSTSTGGGHGRGQSGRGQVDRRSDQMRGTVSRENLLTRHELVSTLPGLVGDRPERMILGRDEPVAVDLEGGDHVAVRPGAGDDPPASDPRARVVAQTTPSAYPHVWEQSI